MATRTWALIDVERGVYVDEVLIVPEQVGGPAAGYSIKKRRLRGGLCDGVDVVEVDNGLLRFALLPTRGMGLWKIWRGELELGWKSPVRGPVHPQFVPVWEPGGIGWLSGFDELLCRCGLESNGAPEWAPDGRLKYPLHGRIANLPAHQLTLSVDGDTGEIVVAGLVDEARLYHNKLRLRSSVRTKVGSSTVWITDEISNLSAEPGEVQLLYHINVGRPLLEPGAKVVLPVKTLVPRNARAAEGLPNWDTYASDTVGFAEQVYFMELAADGEGRTQALLRSEHGHQGMCLHFNKRQLPTFSLWKSTQADKDGYVTGLEPGINFPNPRSYEKEQGRVVQLPPGTQLKVELGIEVLADAQGVARAEHNIAELQRNVTPKIYERPMPGWTTG